MKLEEENKVKNYVLSSLREYRIELQSDCFPFYIHIRSVDDIWFSISGYKVNYSLEVLYDLANLLNKEEKDIYIISSLYHNIIQEIILKLYGKN